MTTFQTWQHAARLWTEAHSLLEALEPFEGARARRLRHAAWFRLCRRARALDKACAEHWGPLED